jgi:hypothetical protein
MITVRPDGTIRRDDMLDASMAAVHQCGLLPPDDRWW